MVEGGGGGRAGKALPNLLQILSGVNILQCKYFTIEIFKYLFFVVLETEILKFFCLSFGGVCFCASLADYIKNKNPGSGMNISVGFPHLNIILKNIFLFFSLE